MVELISWKDQELEKLKKDLDRLFNRRCLNYGVDLFCRELEEAPSIELYETNEAITVKAALPGINIEDLDISLAGRTLTIAGKRKEETVEKDRYYHTVRKRFGSFSRSVTLPCRVNADEVEANFEDGILNIVMPKRKPKTTHGVKIKVK